MRAAGERQNKKASCLCRAKVGSIGRFPEGYCCFPDGVEHGINQANSLLPAAIWVIPKKPLLLTTHEEFSERPRLANTWRRNPGGSWLAEFPGCSPRTLGSFPACKHDSLAWGLNGNCRGSAGGFAWTFIGFLLPNSQFERLRVGKGLGKEEGEPQGRRDGRRAGAALSLCSHKVQGICFGVIFDVLFLVHQATEYDQLPSALHHRV